MASRFVNYQKDVQVTPAGLVPLKSLCLVLKTW